MSKELSNIEMLKLNRKKLHEFMNDDLFGSNESTLDFIAVSILTSMDALQEIEARQKRICNWLEKHEGAKGLMEGN